jgi:hypothetical protein
MANGSPPGPGVDARGNPVIDPTANVLGYIDAAIKRQDDLRAAEAALNESRDGHLRDVASLRAAHAKELRVLEAQRIDAIRAVDVGQVQRAADVQAATALTLAKQVADSAETLRKQVSDTQAASDAALAGAIGPIAKDIAELRKAQYEQQGQKQQVVETREVGAGARQWTGIIIAAAIGFASLILAASGIAIALLVHKGP